MAFGLSRDEIFFIFILALALVSVTLVYADANGPPVITNISSNPPLPLSNNGSAQNLTINFTSDEYPINVTFKLYNESGVWVDTSERTELANSGELPVNYTIPETLNDGNYTLRMNVTDPDENKTFEFIGNFTVDTVLPTALLPVYTNRTWSRPSTELTLNISVNDSNFGVSSDCSVYINGSSVGTITRSGSWCNGSVTVPSLDEDDQVINVTIDDDAGNVGFNDSFTTRIDNTLPTVEMPYYTNGTTSRGGGKVTLNISVSDNRSGVGASCTVRINGQDVAESPVTQSNGWCNVSATVPALPTGLYNMSQRVQDNVGLWGWNITFMIYVDNDAPSPSLEQSNVTTLDPLDMVEFGVYWTDAGSASLSRYILVWNATGIWTNDSDQAFGGAEGVWSNVTKTMDAAWEGNVIMWGIYANDSVGNIAGPSSSQLITINSDNPSVEIQVPTNESTIRSTQDIFTTITDAGTIESTLWRWENSTDNGAWTTLTQGTPSSNYTSSWDTSAVMGGEYWLHVFVNDSSDNENSTYYLITVDNTAPNITNVQSSFITNVSATITWITDESANGTVQYGTDISLGNLETNSSSLTNHSIPLASLSTNTEYCYNITSCDQFGNCRTEGMHDFITFETCAIAWSGWSSWSTCSGGSQSRTRTRTCYGWQLQTDTGTQSCSSYIPPATPSNPPPTNETEEPENETVDEPDVVNWTEPGPSEPETANETHDFVTPVNDTVGVVWENITWKKPVRVEINSTEMGVNEIIFWVKNRKTVQTQLTIKTVREEVPQVVRENMEIQMQKKVYKYLEINKTNIEDNELENVTIKFQVEKAWLEENNVSENDVVLWRYTTEWVQLPTVKVSENNIFVFYEASSPGFSFFAIGEKDAEGEPFAFELNFEVIYVIMVLFIAAYGLIMGSYTTILNLKSYYEKIRRRKNRYNPYKPYNKIS